MPNNKYNFLPLYICTAVFAAVLVIFPEKASDYAKNGIIVWYKNVLPVMLPFLTIAIFSAEIGLSDSMAKIFSYPLGKLLNLSGYGGFALISAVLSGYPAGAKITAKLLSENKLTLSEAKKILVLSDVTSPAFIIGTVGVNMFGSKKTGILLLISHYLSALIMCIAIKGENRSHYSNTPKNTPFAAALSNSAAQASQTLILICCFIVIFSVAAGFIIDFNLVPSALFGIKARTADYILISLIEMTNGCNLLSASHSTINICAACFAVSFGGLCICFQILGTLSKTPIKPSYIFLMKIIHGFLSMFIILIISAFCGSCK